VVAALERYLTYHPENAQVTKMLADAYLEQKNYTLAGATYQKALDKLPESEKAMRADALRNQGYSAQMRGKADDAIAAYGKSLTLEDNRQVRVNLALAYHQQKQYEKALNEYRRLLISEPQSVELRKNTGQVLLALGDQAYQKKDYPGALTRYQDALL